MRTLMILSLCVLAALIVPQGSALNYRGTGHGSGDLTFDEVDDADDVHCRDGTLTVSLLPYWADVVRDDGWLTLSWEFTAPADATVRPHKMVYFRLPGTCVVEEQGVHIPPGHGSPGTGYAYENADGCTWTKMRLGPLGPATSFHFERHHCFPGSNTSTPYTYVLNGTVAFP